MPPSKRRRTNGPVTTPKTAQQSTLSFRSTKARATDGAKEPTKPSKLSGLKAPGPEGSDDTTERISARDGTPTEDLVNGSDGASRVSDGDANATCTANEEEQELDRIARELPESKIKSYWAIKERERKAPRVHQQDLGVREKIMREFDMNSRYGPSIGITRLSRWRRAHNLGMDPPIEVLAVLLKATSAGRDRINNTENSIIDELITSSRVRGDGAVEV